MAKVISKRTQKLVNDPYQAQLLIAYLTDPKRRKSIRIKLVGEEYEVYEVDENGNIKMPEDKNALVPAE